MIRQLRRKTLMNFNERIVNFIKCLAIVRTYRYNKIRKISERLCLYGGKISESLCSY